MLRKLIELLPVSRRKYAEGLEQVAKVIEGLIEAEANHSQIEMSIIQQMQKGKPQKSMPTSTKKNNRDAMFQ